MENSRKAIPNVVYNAPKGMTVEVIVDDTTAWLSQAGIAKLFCQGRPKITKHINKIIGSGEIDRAAVCSIMEHTAADGKVYSTRFYNLDIILCIGYRFDFQTAQDFRKFCEVEIKKWGHRKNARNEFLKFERVRKATIPYCNEFLKLSADGYVTVDALSEYMNGIVSLRNECYNEDEINRISESLSVFPKDIRGYLCHYGKEMIFQPNHLMCKLATLRDERNCINYEFLIEYDIFDPVTEIYYGVKAVSDELVSMDCFIECVEKEWNSIKKKHLEYEKTRRGFYTKLESRLKETDNGSNGTFWPFWIRYDVEREEFLEVVHNLETLFDDFCRSLKLKPGYKRGFQNIKNILKNRRFDEAVFGEIDKIIETQLKRDSVVDFHNIVLPRLEERGLIKKCSFGKPYELTGRLKELSTYMQIAFYQMAARRICESKEKCKKDKDAVELKRKDLNPDLPISELCKIIRQGDGRKTNVKSWGNRFNDKDEPETYSEMKKEVESWFLTTPKGAF